MRDDSAAFEDVFCLRAPCPPLLPLVARWRGNKNQSLLAVRTHGESFVLARLVAFSTASCGDLGVGASTTT